MLNEQSTLNEDILSGYGFDVYKAFIEPFTDAGKVIKGELGKLSTKAAAGIARIATLAASLVIPGLDDTIQKIDDYEKRTLQKLESDPGYRKAWNVIEPHVKTGAKKMFFLYDPVGYITSELVTQAPAAAWETSNVFLGQVPRSALESAGVKMKKRRGPSFKEEWDRLLKRASSLEESRRRHLSEAISRESLGEFLIQPEIQQLLKSSEVVKTMSAAVEEMGNESAQTLIDDINAMLKVSSLNELEKLLGKPIDRSDLEDIESEEQGDAEQVVLAQVKQEIRKNAIEMIGNRLGELGLAGSTDHPYHKIMAKVIQSLVPAS
jgi:hypothetical protein